MQFILMRYSRNIRKLLLMLMKYFRNTRKILLMLMKYFRNTRRILLMLKKTWDGQDERLDICPVCSTEPAPNYSNPTHENNHHLIIGSGADISQDACLWSPHASSRPHWGWRGLCWSCWRWWGRGRVGGSDPLVSGRSRHRPQSVGNMKISHKR